MTKTTATAFGLDISCEEPLAFLEGSVAQRTGRRHSISVQEADIASWPGSAELVCDERQPDGSAIFSIEAHPQAGYLISGPDYGSFLLSADGAHLLCSPGDRPTATWQRLLIAQVLPFAALLRGLEVFHASAVVMEAESVAFLGPSHVGKSSLALELCSRGAAFLADDVVALEIKGDELLAHPGTPLVGLDHVEGERRRTQEGTTSEERPTLEETVAINDRERLVRMSGGTEPASLAALLFLDRSSGNPAGVCFEPVADPQMLLGATFNFVLAAPERLRRLLDVCALAAQRRVERVSIGADVDAAQLAVAVAQRLNTTT